MTTKVDRTPALPSDIRIAREAIKDLNGVEVLREFEWNERVGRWTLLVRLNLSATVQRVPARSAWYVVVKPTYPWGGLDIFPAKRNGLEDTYNHQSLNRHGDDRLPWRTGKICVDTGVHALGPTFDVEPYDAHLRLRWRLQRALMWLRAADRDELVVVGEPFELPDFDRPISPLLAFWEDGRTWRRWTEVEETSGLVRLGVLRTEPDVVVVQSFQNRRGEDLVAPDWGTHLRAAHSSNAGLWIRLSGVPHLSPWRAPMTWDELREALEPEGIAIPDDLRSLLATVRDGRPHYLLLGYPIAELVGSDPEMLYWSAIRLPRLSRGKRPGFRNGEAAAWMNDRASIFRGSNELGWVRTENWSPTDLSGRGRYPDAVTQRRFLMIGGGALGSAVAEALVRGGVTDVLLSEQDTICAGNLVRHSATLEDVGTRKGVTLASRLNSASPHAGVTPIGSFPPRDSTEQNQVAEAEVIIDLTGDPSVPAALGAYEWAGEKLFLSISLGLGAKRLFCFASRGEIFDHDSFVDRLQPWLQLQVKEADGIELPREGIGCWHPVFPARIDDVWLLASTAVKWIEGRIREPPSDPEMVVFEQVEDGHDLQGLRKLSCPDERE